MVSEPWSRAPRRKQKLRVSEVTVLGLRKRVAKPRVRPDVHGKIILKMKNK
jgi:hypothetical protein